MIKLSRFFCVLGSAWLAVAVSGCNPKGESGFSPVSGTVTLDGEPVAGAKVMFVPVKYRDSEMDNLPYSYATTDENGRYNLRREGGKRGAVVGKHTVFISTAESIISEIRDIQSQELPEKIGETSKDLQLKDNEPKKSVASKLGTAQPDRSKPATQDPKKPNETLPSISLTDEGKDKVVDIHGQELVESKWRKRKVLKGETIQSRYNTNSTLEFTVKAGTSNQANFKLSTFPD